MTARDDKGDAVARIAMKWCPENPLRCVSAIEEAFALSHARPKGEQTAESLLNGMARALEQNIKGQVKVDPAGMLKVVRMAVSFLSTTRRTNNQALDAPMPVLEWIWHMDLHLTEHDEPHAGRALRAAWPHVREYMVKLGEELGAAKHLDYMEHPLGHDSPRSATPCIEDGPFKGLPKPVKVPEGYVMVDEKSFGVILDVLTEEQTREICMKEGERLYLNRADGGKQT